MKNRHQDYLLCIRLNPQDSELPHGDPRELVGLAGEGGSFVRGPRLAPLFSLAWLMEKSEKMNFK